MLDPEIPPPPDPDASVEEWRKANDLFLARQGRRAARVPRRFGVGVLLLFVLLYSLLFSFLSVLGAPAVVFACVALYVTSIGLGQMLLFGGERPREASIWVGTPVLMLIYIVGSAAALLSDVSQTGRALLPEDLLGLACSLVMGPILAVPISYVTGAAIAGVFLLLDRVRTGVWNPDPDRLLPPPPSPPDEAPSSRPPA